MKTSQTQKVLNYLQNNDNGITSFDAFERFNITRLSSVIFILKHEGYKITSTLEKKKYSDGSYSLYSRYKLEA